MDVSVQRLLQIVGEEYVKVRLLEEEVARLKQLVEQLKEKAIHEPSSQKDGAVNL